MMVKQIHLGLPFPGQGQAALILPCSPNTYQLTE
jgi:hypothetical protein